ncbi:MAG: hypothetical protein RBT19_14810, partial [Tenuifilaceae bacterium]|nr:hypothetical protein [Tenuifilaceae bacterium]
VTELNEFKTISKFIGDQSFGLSVLYESQGLFRSSLSQVVRKINAMLKIAIGINRIELNVFILICFTAK